MPLPADHAVTERTQIYPSSTVTVQVTGRRAVMSEIGLVSAAEQADGLIVKVIGLGPV